MGVASLVLALASLIILFLSPYASLLMAFVALALGIAELVKRKKEKGPKSFAIISIVLSSISIFVFTCIIIYSLAAINLLTDASTSVNSISTDLKNSIDSINSLRGK